MNDSWDTSRRVRLWLAATVASVCALGVAGIIALAGGESEGPGAGQTASTSLGSAGPHSHSGDLDVPGLSETELRRLETATLGPDHAREHAELRRGLRLRKPPTAAQVRRARTRAMAAADDAGDPAEVGRWDFDATVTLPIVAIHVAMLPTGKVMVFSFPEGPRENSARAWLWDPATGALVRKDPPLWLDPRDGQLKPANIWCAGHTFTADGELVVFGGNLDFERPPLTWKGLNKVYTFNPFTETWREQPDMAHGRWYPSGVRLADGRIPITSGLDETGTGDMTEEVEMFTPPSAPGGLGTIDLIGHTSYDDPSLPPTGEYYPHMFAMPSGRALVVGRDRDQDWYLNPPPADPDPDAFSWTEAPHKSQRRLWGNAVLVPDGPGGSTKVMTLGGTHYSVIPSTNTTEVFDEAHPEAGWQPAPPLVVGRGHANTVLLPDGSMVQVGGGIGRDDSISSPQHGSTPEQLQIELWDPETGEWRLGPPQAEGRAYHSTAMLLPDGRVFSAGDEYHGGSASDTAEIYEPPYLFRGPRPAISSAPEAIEIGAGFGVMTPDDDIAGATLVAPGSVTHAVDMNQRVIPLELTRRSTGCVDLVAPPSVDAAPPGYYMLFLLDDDGVPSVAKFVKLGVGGVVPAACDVPPPQPPTDPPVGDVDPPLDDTPPAVVPKPAPAISRLKLSGKRIGFRLSRQATVRISFERRRPGRRPSYRRLRTVLIVRGRAGANSVAFYPLRRGFRAGRYRLVANASDSAGRRSATVRAGFEVVVHAQPSRR